MNTEKDQDQSVILTPGQQLRLAREKLGYSQEYVANQLCLKQSTVRDIEEDKNPLDLALTFIRGYLRAYARLVEIPENTFFPTPDVQATAPVHDLTDVPIRGFPLNKARTRKIRDSWLMRITWLILLIVLGLTATWWWQNHRMQRQVINDMKIESSNQLSQTAGQGRTLVLGNQTPVLNSQTAVNTQSQPVAIVGVNPPVSNASVNVTPVNNELSLAIEMQRQASLFPNQSALLSAEAATQLQVAEDLLNMDFNANCWVDVRDSTGQRLASGIQQGGSKIELSGKPPYQIKIGVPSAVTITFKGKTVDLRQLKRGRSGSLVLPE